MDLQDTNLENTNGTQAIQPLVDTALAEFSALAPEIRQMIWKEVCNIARVIEIRRRHNSERYLISVGIPSALQVDREARYTSFKYYSPAFMSECPAFTDPSGLTLDALPGTYVNWAVDIICPIEHHHYGNIPAFNLLSGFEFYDGLASMGCIRRLAIDASIDPRHIETIEGFLGYTTLEEIIIYTTSGKKSQDRARPVTPYNPATSVTITTSNAQDLRYDTLTTFLEEDRHCKSLGLFVMFACQDVCVQIKLKEIELKDPGREQLSESLKKITFKLAIQPPTSEHRMKLRSANK